MKFGAILLLSFCPHSPAALAQVYLEAEEQELDDKQQQALSLIEEPQREFLFQLYAEHLHKRTSWLCCLPFCSLSRVCIGTNFRQTFVSLASVLLESFYVALTLAVGLCYLSTPYQMVPVVKGVNAQQVQPKACCYLTSFDFVLSLCILLLCLIFICSSSFFTDGQDTNALLSLCLWNKLGSLEAAVPETLKAWVMFDTRVKICRIISDPLLLLTPDLSRLFSYKGVES